MLKKTARTALGAAAIAAVLSILSIFSAAASSGKTGGADSRPPAPPRLAVVVSVDGLSWPRLAAYEPWFGGGFKRLLSEGRVERACRYRHINTETGPGHASLGTGAPPRVTGIVANRWFVSRPDGSLRSVYCTDQAVEDPVTKSVRVFPGPGNLRVPTMADRLKDRYPAARVVSISGKDRGAIFLAGKNRSHSVWWWDKETGRFTTSEAYDTGAPGAVEVAAAVTKWNRWRGGGFLPGRLGLLWRKLTSPFAEAPPDAPRPVPAAALAAYQVPAIGLGWDHDLSTSADGYFGGIYTSPVVDELVADLALAVLKDGDIGLGLRESPDVLFLSFSGQDTVSHNYGSESEENLDVLRRLDVQLGKILDLLDREYPEGRVVVALSADHGFLPIPEYGRKVDRRFRGGRIVDGSYPMVGALEKLNRNLSGELCLPEGSRPIWGAEGFSLKYNLPALRALRTAPGTCGPGGAPVTAADLDRVLPGVVRTLFAEEIADVLLVSGAAAWNPSLPYVEFARNDLDPSRSAEAFLIPRPNVLMHWDPSRGSGHGSHYDPETNVPLMFRGKGITAMRSDAPTTPYDLAPTVGRLFGIDLPDSVGRPIPLGR